MNAFQDIKNERILFSPLNWGFGHVSRSIPMLQALLDNKNHVTIACTQEHREIYEEYLTEVDYILWKGYPFKFSGKGNFGLDLFRSFSKLKKRGKEELVELESKADFTLLLSENRYYFRSTKTKSIFITHQVSLSLPWYLRLAQKIHIKLINSFDELWVVDEENIGLAGRLSERVPQICIPTRYIGLLSRFGNDSTHNSKEETTILISGPEPYAKQFYREQKDKIRQDKVAIIYKGKIETKEGIENISWKEIDEHLRNSKRLISRSGYTTLMDVHFLKCETEWYPTPGQWEQEYLAQIHR